MKRITNRAKDHPAVIWLGILASLIAVGTFLWGLHQFPQHDSKPRQKFDRDMAELLMGAVHELNNNQDYLDALKQFWMQSTETKPIRVPCCEKTHSFFSKYFDVVAESVYGEEDKLFTLVSLDDNGTKIIENSIFQMSLEKFNSAYDLTFDDVRLVNGFLLWYLGLMANKHLPREFIVSLPQPQNTLEKVGSRYEMREFTLDGKPIVEYSYLLGLLD